MFAASKNFVKMRAFEKCKIKRAEKMLKLLREGRDTELLFEFNRNKSLNRLQKLRLIEVVDGKFKITDKGRIADQMGVKNYLENIDLKKEITEFSLEKTAEKGIGILWSFIVILMILLVFLAFKWSF